MTTLVPSSMLNQDGGLTSSALASNSVTTAKIVDANVTSAKLATGAALGAGVFIGREHAQAEYKWIEHYGHGRRANLPWWGWADPRVWNFHSWFWNLTLPVVAVVVIAQFKVI